MDPIGLSLTAIVVVIAGVLVLRLHPFLALSFATLFVAVCTPTEQLRANALKEKGSVVHTISDARVQVSKGKLFQGQFNAYRQDDNKRSFQRIGRIAVGAISETNAGSSDADSETDGTTNTSWAIESPDGEVRAGDLLLHESLEGTVASQAKASAGKRFATGFGDTCRKIGILIAMASVIGTCLLESGAARKIVDTIRGSVGEKRTPLAFAVSGFVVGIPVFFDTVFYLLMPLARAMRIRTGNNYLLYVMSIVVGATMAHSLVPPTPGPLLVASEIDGVSVGNMILGGLIVGSIAVASGFAYILIANRIWEIPLRGDDSDIDTQNAGEDPETRRVSEEPSTLTRSAGEASHTPDSSPSFAFSLLPILLPVLLLSAKTLTDSQQSTPGWLEFLGDKNIALTLAAIVALVILALTRRTNSGGSNNRFDGISRALASGGQIILITAAGGAFGHVLRQCGIAEAIQSRFPATQNGMTLLCVAFVLTAIVRFAQGSATVAMITSVSIVAPIAAGIDLPYHPVYLALAIGCGSKPLPWMNDSGFWIVGKMSGMNEGETLKTFSATLTIMGTVGFLVTLFGARFLPLI